MKRIALLPLVVTLAACAPQDNSKIVGLQDQVEALSTKFEHLEKQLEEQKQDASIKELFASFSKVAYLTPGADGYSLVSYDLGTFTVKIKDVKSYANGSRVVLQFGNPLSATVRGLKLDLDWGKVDEKGLSIGDSEKTKTFTLAQDLVGGRWSSIPFILEGIPPTELGFVRVHDVSHTGIRLLGD